VPARVLDFRQRHGRVPYGALTWQSSLPAHRETDGARGHRPILFGDFAMTGLRFGQPAPDFTLPSTSGADIALSALRGQDVVLVFYCFDWGSI
jgi:hypothetical protein